MLNIIQDTIVFAVGLAMLAIVAMYGCAKPKAEIQYCLYEADCNIATVVTIDCCTSDWQEYDCMVIGSCLKN